MNIFVGNLSLEITEHELREVFSDYGEVNSVNIMNDKYIGSGQQLGYGFVEMSSYNDGQAAIKALNGMVMKNCEIVVIQALPLSRDDKPYSGKRRSMFSGRFSKVVRQRTL